MTPALFDLLRLENPAYRTVGVQHGKTGHNFVATIAVEVHGHRLMRRAIATRVLDCPERFPVAVKGPNLGVTSLDQHIGQAGIARDVHEDQAIARILGQGQATFLASGRALQFKHEAVAGKHHFVLSVAVPVVNLAGHIVVKFLATDLRIAPAPEHAAVEPLRDNGAGVVNVILVHVARADDFHLTIAVEITRDDPRAAVFGIERDAPPGLDDRRIGRLRGGGLG